MTSNYDKYVQPETWPLPVDRVGYIFQGLHIQNNMTEIRCVGNFGEPVAGRVYILATVSREDASGAIVAIHTYCEACRKLIG